MRKNTPFLRIREKLEPGTVMVLGIVPIVLFLILWSALTWGKMDVVTLPDGILDGNPEDIPRAGRVVKDRLALKIANAKLVHNLETDNQYVVCGNATYPLHDLYARQIGNDVQVSLKEGKFIARDILVPRHEKTPEAPPLADIPKETPREGTPNVGETRPGYVGRGGTVVPPPPTSPAVAVTPAPAPDRENPVLLKFRYEQIQTRFFSAAILPSPGDVMRAFPGLWYERGLARNVMISFRRVIMGFMAAFLLTFPLGVLMGTFSKVRAMFTPMMTFGGYLPIPTLVPLSMALFGTSEMQKVMFLALAFVVYLLPLIVRSIEEVDTVFLQTGYTLGANRWQVMIHILLGISLPNIYDAMRMGFGVGWGYIILAELVGSEGGIGFAISASQRRALTADVYLILVVIVGLAFITDKLWEYCGEWLFPYRSLKR
jgi:ABC-type nitrate/sulfonate/bicarbonate transport system permease component